MNIQYSHQRVFSKFATIAIEVLPHGGITIAMETVPVEMFLEMQVGDQLEVEVGKAVCSDKDNYNKKLGREIAQGRMKNVILDVIVKTDSEVLLTDKTNHYCLRLSSTGKKVFFLDYE